MEVNIQQASLALWFLNKMLVLFRNKTKYHFFFNQASYTSSAWTAGRSQRASTDQWAAAEIYLLPSWCATMREPLPDLNHWTCRQQRIWQYLIEKVCKALSSPYERINRSCWRMCVPRAWLFFHPAYPAVHLAILTFIWFLHISYLCSYHISVRMDMCFRGPSLLMIESKSKIASLEESNAYIQKILNSMKLFFGLSALSYCDYQCGRTVRLL